MTDPGPPDESHSDGSPLRDQTQGGDPSLREGEDFYMDGPYLVFTEAYHLKRGECCQSGCRHCPWRYDPTALDD